MSRLVTTVERLAQELCSSNAETGDGLQPQMRIRTSAIKSWTFPSELGLACEHASNKRHDLVSLFFYFFLNLLVCGCVVCVNIVSPVEVRRQVSGPSYLPPWFEVPFSLFCCTSDPRLVCPSAQVTLLPLPPMRL